MIVPGPVNFANFKSTAPYLCNLVTTICRAEGLAVAAVDSAVESEVPITSTLDPFFSSLEASSS